MELWHSQSDTIFTFRAVYPIRPRIQRIPDDQPDAPLFTMLARHDIRRAENRPAVSVLLGEPESCQRLWAGWASSQSRDVIQLDVPSRAAASSAVVAALLQQRDLVADVFQELGRRTGHSATVLRAEFSVRSGPERVLWLNRLGLHDDLDDLDRLCRLLLSRTAKQASDRHERQCDQPLQDQLGWPPTRLLGVVSRLVPGKELPAVAFTWRESSLERLSGTADEIFSLASAAPRIPIALLLPSAAQSLLLEGARETRALAFLREGLVDLAAASNSGAGPAAEAESLSEASDCDAASTLDSNAEDDAARSAAERFLFEVLEATPATTGLFALNVKLDFAFGGGRAAEIDLACLEFKLAIEIDGHYHFLSPDSYRRDRRKDLELQRRGWLVMRFLADDVGARQEEIIAAIVGAVEERRRESRK